MDRIIIIKQEVGQNLKSAIKASIKSISELLGNSDIDSDICMVGSYYLAKDSMRPAEEAKYWAVITDENAEYSELRFEANCGEYVFGLEEAVIATAN